MNICMFRGHCTRDVMMFESSNGVKIAKFTMGVKSYGNKDDKDVFPQFTCFGKVAEKAEKIAMKGNMLFVEGRFVENTYTNKKGETVYDKSFVVSQLNLCSGIINNNVEDSAVEQYQPAQPTQFAQQQFNPYTGQEPELNITSDDLPF